MVKRKCTPHDLRIINYFWQSKGDVTRYIDWEAVKDDFFATFPHIADLRKTFESTANALDREMKRLDDVAIEMEDASDE